MSGPFLLSINAHPPMQISLVRNILRPMQTLIRSTLS